MKSSAATPTIAIIGSGFAGIAMAIRLKRAGIDSFVIYERSDRIGGTWRDNRYPGAGCDIPSILYSFSFEPPFEWSDVYARQGEILAYLERCAERHGLDRHLRFNANIVAGAFDETSGTWSLRLDGGEEVRAAVVISGVGQLSNGQTPDIPGLESFGGSWFHSAQWKQGQPLSGKRVAIVGNGASGVQLTPHVAAAAKTLTIFQRTPSWIIPHIPADRPYRAWEKWAFRHVPYYAALHRFFIFCLLDSRIFLFFKGSWLNKLFEWVAARNIESAISDTTLRKQLTPNYPFGCKRVLLSSDYYPAIARDNVRLQTSPIAHVDREGIVTRDGTHHPLDVIIFATGFDTHRYLSPVELEGTDGRLTSSVWRDGAEAYLGMTASGFPNLFMLFGPNTSLGHNSIIFIIECQVRYILKCITRIMDRGLLYLDVRDDVQAAYNQNLQNQLEKTQWASCMSWYRTATGKITANWAGSASRYWWRTRNVDLTAYRQVARPRDGSGLEV